MPGMTTTAPTDLSSYNSRTVVIEVTGVCRPDVVRTSNYTLKVPYSRLSQTIQRINSQGGKVASITIGSKSPNSEESSE